VVRSQDTEGVEYYVNLKEHSCTCPAARLNPICKHAFACDQFSDYLHDCLSHDDQLLYSIEPAIENEESDMASKMGNFENDLNAEAQPEVESEVESAVEDPELTKTRVINYFVKIK
jgi:hypothetical protein